MRLYRKARQVMEAEGVAGLARRTHARMFPKKETPILGHYKTEDEFGRAKQAFNDKARTLGLGELDKYYWYHTVDLGKGLITPGDFDYRAALSHFKFPQNMQGMTVLDVGSATGFFAFEFEKRGATVTSVELPSITNWDMPKGEDREITLKGLMAFHKVQTVEEVYHYHLDGPFQFCKDILKSQIRRCYSSVYDLSPEKLGAEGFDLIFAGDIFLHIFSPLTALTVLAPLCRGTLVICQHLINEDPTDPPMMYYGGGEVRTADGRTWWHPNWTCYKQMLKRLGFQNVTIVDHVNDVQAKPGRGYERTVIHANKVASQNKIASQTM